MPCRHMDTMPDIQFTLNGIVYTLTPDDYVMKIEAEGKQKRKDPRGGLRFVFRNLGYFF